MHLQPPEGTLNSVPEYLTPRQIAQMLQVRELTVRLWIRRGLLKGVRVGRQWRVTRVALEQFLSEGQR
jgi:excisionase family DNA binding protein